MGCVIVLKGDELAIRRSQIQYMQAPAPAQQTAWPEAAPLPPMSGPPMPSSAPPMAAPPAPEAAIDGVEVRPVLNADGRAAPRSQDADPEFLACTIGVSDILLMLQSRNVTKNHDAACKARTRDYVATTVPRLSLAICVL